MAGCCFSSGQYRCGITKIVAREIDPLDSVVVGIGVLQAGTRYNIVANGQPLKALFEHLVRKRANLFYNESKKLPMKLPSLIEQKLLIFLFMRQRIH